MKKMNDEDFVYDEDEKPKRSGSKLFLVLSLLLSISIGLCLGFFLGMVSLVNVMGDVTENVTVIMELDEDRMMDYIVTFMNEEYGDLIRASLMDKDIELNMTNNEKMKLVIEGLNLDFQSLDLDNETIAMIEEAKKHPEQRDISQTAQNFVPGVSG